VACDLAQVDVVRTHWPFLRDRRIDAYQGITERYLDQGTLTVDR
jgi:N-carbamoylputrescine amidase